MKTLKALIVEDYHCDLIKEACESQAKDKLRFECGEAATNLDQANRAIEAELPDVVVLDLYFPKKAGGSPDFFAPGFLGELERRKKGVLRPPAIPVIVVSGEGLEKDEFDHLSNWLADGTIHDVVPKSLAKNKVLFQRLLRYKIGDLYKQARRSTEVDATRTRFDFDRDWIGKSDQSKTIEQRIKQVAKTNCTVLIRGESGVGKELVARAIHDYSPRKDEKFLSLNCAAIPEMLLESELFGHIKGAFTGAIADKAGAFETANLGTIFLDEIGDMKLEMQVKLLRVLDGYPFQRVGGGDAIQVDVRVVAATNQPLELAVKSDKFRKELFYRLQVFEVHVPSVRQRREDIRELAHHFLNRYAAEMKRGEMTFSNLAVQKLEEHDWPGNVRELRNVIERAVVVCTTAEVDADSIELLTLDVATTEGPIATPQEETEAARKFVATIVNSGALANPSNEVRAAWKSLKRPIHAPIILEAIRDKLVANNRLDEIGHLCLDIFQKRCGLVDRSRLPKPRNRDKHQLLWEDVDEVTHYKVLLFIVLGGSFRNVDTLRSFTGLTSVRIAHCRENLEMFLDVEEGAVMRIIGRGETEDDFKVDPWVERIFDKTLLSSFCTADVHPLLDALESALQKEKAQKGRSKEGREQVFQHANLNVHNYWKLLWYLAKFGQKNVDNLDYLLQTGAATTNKYCQNLSGFPSPTNQVRLLEELAADSEELKQSSYKLSPKMHST